MRDHADIYVVGISNGGDDQETISGLSCYSDPYETNEHQEEQHFLSMEKYQRTPSRAGT